MDKEHGDLGGGAAGDNIHARFGIDGFETQRSQWRHNMRHTFRFHTHEVS